MILPEEQEQDLSLLPGRSHVVKTGQRIDRMPASHPYTALISQALPW